MQTLKTFSFSHTTRLKKSQPNLQAGRPSAVAAVPNSRSQRSRCSTQLRAADALKPTPNAVIIDLDAIVQGLEVASTAWAFAAATATAGEIAGTPGVYTRYMQQLLPVLQQPYESVFMLRLLHEEGIVGARSTAGREGPVVGRPVRQSGSRPLLLNEILEHWVDEIKPTCLLRWSRQAGCSCSQLEQQVMEAYMQAQRTVQWKVLDVQQQCHGSSTTTTTTSSTTTSSISSSSSQALVRAIAASVAAAANTTSSSHSSMLAASATQAGTATATKPDQLANSSSGSSGSSSADAVSVVVQPYVSVAPCLQHCPVQVHIASTYPPDFTQAVLAAVQLPCTGQRADAMQQQQQQMQLVVGSSILHCLQQLQCQATSSSSSSSSTGAAAAAQSQVVVVVSSPSKASPTALVSQQEPLQQQQQQQHLAHSLTLQEPFHVAEWACKAPSLRVRALSGRGLGLLSECGLAEMLGADSSDAVMDGIAWR